MPEEKDAPSLELPSFRLGRRRRTAAASDGEPEVAPRTPVPDDSPRPGADETTPTRTVPVTSPEPTAPPPPPDEPKERATSLLPELVPTDTATTVASLPVPVPDAVPTRAAGATVPGAPDARSPAEPRSAPLLGLGALPAALLTGAVVGLLTALLGYASQRLCEGVRGTSSCGAPGVLMLLAILVAMAVVGAGLLRLALVREATSTSVLAVALLAVLVMLFLLDAAFSPAMFVLVPLLSAGCYAVAHWVTTTATATHD